MTQEKITNLKEQLESIAKSIEEKNNLSANDQIYLLLKYYRVSETLKKYKRMTQTLKNVADDLLPN